MPIKIEKITEPCALGESPHWDDRQQALFFINYRNGVNKYVPSTGVHTKTTLENFYGETDMKSVFICYTKIFLTKKVLNKPTDYLTYFNNINFEYGQLDMWNPERSEAVFLARANVLFVQDSDGHLGFIVPVDSVTGHFVAGIGRRFLIIEWDGEEGSKASLLKDLGEVDVYEPTNNINDGKADPKGRIFAGSMGHVDSLFKEEKPRGSLFRLDAGKGYKIDKVWDNIRLSNGLAWDPEGKAMYYVDSLEAKIRRYDYDLETGNISNLSYIYDFSEKKDEGMPDGMTIDTDGNLWVAMMQGSSVVKIDPRKKEIVEKIEMPVSQITSVTFGGSNLDVLFVTTGNFKINDSVEANPLAGATFMVTGLGVKGLPNVRFKY